MGNNRCDGARTHRGISKEAEKICTSIDEYQEGTYAATVLFSPRGTLRGAEPPERGPILEAIRQLSQGMDGPVPIVLTGHSKGGALSIFVSFLLKRAIYRHNLQNELRIDVVTSVEGPRTGDSRWVHRYVHHMQLHNRHFNVYRIVKRNDPVPETPTPREPLVVDELKPWYSHVPGLVVVPVQTMLTGHGGRLHYPPMFFCDVGPGEGINDAQVLPVARSVVFDAYRPQRGHHFQAPPLANGEQSEFEAYRTTDLCMLTEVYPHDGDGAPRRVYEVGGMPPGGLLPYRLIAGARFSDAECQASLAEHVCAESAIPASPFYTMEADYNGAQNLVARGREAATFHTFFGSNFQSRVGGSTLTTINQQAVAYRAVFTRLFDVNRRTADAVIESVHTDVFQFGSQIDFADREVEQPRSIQNNAQSGLRRRFDRD